MGWRVHLTRPGSHRFGGDWTSAKLDAVGKYLAAYTTALKNQPFEKVYIDAFAGTGYRESPRAKLAAPDSHPSLFQDNDAESDSESNAFLDGSASVALKTLPSFDRLIFIERMAERCDSLRRLAADRADLTDRVSILNGDANTELLRLCDEGWKRRRAVLFLDPYGMSVEWRTIEAIARTRAIDLWVLFPSGIGVNRLLPKSGNVPDGWSRRLDSIFGTHDWHDEFYRVERRPTLFGDEDKAVKAGLDRIGAFFINRLQTIFAGVEPKPGILYNSRNSPMYLLCFAVSNPSGCDAALRIAHSALRGLR